MAEVEPAGVGAVAIGSPLITEVLERGRQIAGHQPAQQVERGLHLDLILLDDLGAEPEPVLQEPFLSQPGSGAVEQVVGLAGQAHPIRPVDPDLGRGGREGPEKEQQPEQALQGSPPFDTLDDLPYQARGCASTRGSRAPHGG